MSRTGSCRPTTGAARSSVDGAVMTDPSWKRRKSRHLTTHERSYRRGVDDRDRYRFVAARVARLATLGAGGPHLVPTVFAVLGDVIVCAIDGKPKTTRNLQRLRNIATDPRVSLLVDHYDDDWSTLWWVRVVGTASVHDADSATGSAGLDALVAKYDQYQRARPAGPVIAVAARRWSSWSA